MIKPLRFEGVFPILATPFFEDESLDLASLERLVRFMVSLGVEGVTVLGVLLFLDWRLALFSFVVLPPAAWALVTIGRKMRKRSGRAQEEMASLTGVLQENIAGGRIVRRSSRPTPRKVTFVRVDVRVVPPGPTRRRAALITSLSSTTAPRR